MYLRILKKDLKRKRTMNTILLIFIILSSMFIASSVNNLLATVTALDDYFEMANVPDFWFGTSDRNSAQQYVEFAQENGYTYECRESVVIDSKDVYIDGRQFDYSNTLALAALSQTIKVFDSEEKEITQINDGEIYVTSAMFFGDENQFEIGSAIEITANGVTKTFILKDYMKDPLYGSKMLGQTHFLISENDLAAFSEGNRAILYDCYAYTNDANYYEKFYELGLIGIFDVDLSKMNTMYIMDLIIGIVILVVSVCLILISMVILRFTINFTINEDFREIGVMKAIGLKYKDIQTLYTVKYLAIAIAGAAIGFILSMPFGKMLMKDVSKNIIISRSNGVFINLLCAAFTALIVVFFCRMCTRKIKKFSPVDAIRNGESGERFGKKSAINLGKSKLSTVWFLAVNDILSGMRRFITMILIFMLGLLLIIIPKNTINTMQSSRLVAWFNMAECDHVISSEIYLAPGNDNRAILEDNVESVKIFLEENSIPAEVYQEAMMRMSISYQGRKTTSLAFQGIGDITADRYVYTEGTAPQREGEVAVSGVVADRIGAHIGDEVDIGNGDETKKYIITALLQSMNNMGEGIRFYQDEELASENIMGCIGTQIRYTDHPDRKTLDERKTLLENYIIDGEVYSAGEYIATMIGSVDQQLDSVTILIILVVLGINILVTVLMVKSFLAKEKGEIAVLKAIGFKNSSVVAWQTLRIGIVFVIGAIFAILLSTPLSQLTVGPVFRIMGAMSIEFTVKPLEVFVLYPLLIFGVTILSGGITAMQARKIKTRDTANIE